ncbi:hypothetical protein [Streptomyces sp. NPDC048111]|uniref:hypothetical protein n=1 Tax=Streptomyces sp. NPDC048111 TaxID=3365500 RepID=UPI0037175EF7
MRTRARSRVGAGLALAGVLAAGGAVAGCSHAGESSARGTPAPASASPNPPSPHTTSPAELCTHLITYWARRELDEGQGSGLDYQEKGLSDGQNAILLSALAAARAERAAHGAAAGDRVIGQRAEQGCAERYRNGPPTGDPWAQTKQPSPSGSP